MAIAQSTKDYRRYPWDPLGNLEKGSNPFPVIFDTPRNDGHSRGFPPMWGHFFGVLMCSGSIMNRLGWFPFSSHYIHDSSAEFGYSTLPVVPHKAVAEVSKIGNL